MKWRECGACHARKPGVRGGLCGLCRGLTPPARHPTGVNLLGKSQRPGRRMPP